MKKFTIYCLLFLNVPAVAAQELNMWHVLAEVGFENRRNEQLNLEVDVPKFSKHLKSYNQKKIELKGYLIPLTETGTNATYMFSSLPFSMCYFCGGAGPETVIELELSKPIKFVTKQLTMEGVLILNDKDPEHHMYILRGAEIKD